jgi:ribosomal protein S18 acetylase RimI-like enzyme
MPNYIRLLTGDDIPSIEQLLRTSEYTYQRFTLEELSLLLQRSPAMGAFTDTSLRGFILSQLVNPSVAWIGGFGTTWAESHACLNILDTLLEALSERLLARGVHCLHYSGNDAEQDWLRDLLLVRDFKPYRLLYAYDKFDYHIPACGNQQVTIRPVRLTQQGGGSDIPALLAIEEACFEELWRYGASTFHDIAATHPYFVVAELQGKVVGYQFNALEHDYGYLVRVAVHPAAGRQAIGVRLLAEAIRFFERERVSCVMLNSQEDNLHAHRLYEWFGFIRLPQKGFVLRKYL